MLLSADSDVQALARELVPIHPNTTPLGRTLKAVNTWPQDHALSILRAQAFNGAAQLFDELVRQPEKWNCKSAEEFVVGCTPIGGVVPGDLATWYDCLSRALKLASGQPADQHKLTHQEADQFAKEFAEVFNKSAKIIKERERAWTRIKEIRG